MLPGTNYLSAGPIDGSPATLIFAGAGVDYISFLWGSPDLFNSLTVSSTGSSQVFTANGLGFSTTNGDQSVNQVGAVLGTGRREDHEPRVPGPTTFESANFSITPIPEPETYALMLAGLRREGLRRPPSQERLIAVERWPAGQRSGLRPALSMSADVLTPRRGTARLP